MLLWFTGKDHAITKSGDTNLSPFIRYNYEYNLVFGKWMTVVTNTYFIVCGVTRSDLEPTICRILLFTSI
jgi:hypothetical protein